MGKDKKRASKEIKEDKDIEIIKDAEKDAIIKEYEDLLGY